MDWDQSQIDRETRMAFKKLRDYYRREFKLGESDEAFVNWCEIMCAKLREQKAIQSQGK